MTRYQLTRPPTEAVGERGVQAYTEPAKQTSSPYSRRNTEPDAVHRQPRHDEQDYPNSRPNHHRATTYSEWNDQRRRAAAQNPMVEYICAEPREQKRSAPHINLDQQQYKPKQTSKVQDEDEEAPMTIPASYCHQLHASNSFEHRSSHEHCEASISPTANLPSMTKSNTVPHTPNPHQNEVVDKVAEYVLSRSGMNTSLNDHSKHLIEDLATEIIHALKTGSWEHLPQTLVQDVKQILT